MKIKITMAAIVALGLGAAACSEVPFTPQNRIENAKTKVALYSANPMTVQWGEVKVGPNGAVCGTFNAEVESFEVGEKTEWSGPQVFVTDKDGEPINVTEAEDCDGAVKRYAQCEFGTDPAMVDDTVARCKAAVAMEAERRQEQAFDLMRQGGLISSGDGDRDWKTIEASNDSARVSQMGLDREKDRVRFRSSDIFDETYNARMRQVPKDATAAQRVAAANEAAAAATAASEKYLEENGVV